MQNAVFLDRDGTIIEDTGYVGEREKVRFLPGVDKAIKLLNEAGFKVIVVTNQAGVARGYFTEATVKEINQYVQQSLAAKGATIAEFYYCPHHVDGILEEYKKTCHCRKPSPGMIEAAVRDFNIDLGKSCLIGDKASDIEAGWRAGCRTILLSCGEPTDNPPKGAVMPDYVASDLPEAVQWLLKHPYGTK